MHALFIEAGELQQFQDHVAAEIRNLQRRPEEAIGTEVWSTYQAAIAPPERRERERLERLGRQERQARGERTRERIAREQTRPWREQDRWGLRKRVWQERRDRDRAVLELREQALLEWEQQLVGQQSCYMDWLQELQALDPETRAWCAVQVQHLAQEELTPAMWEALWERHKAACLRRATELLTDPEVRGVIGNLRSDANVYMIAKVITPRLLEAIKVGQLDIPRMPSLFAALALLVQVNSAGLDASATEKDT
ncbi:MAG: hypothetical protein H0X37_14560 [Herpetosiphonaceae bacterium]|nr:hypothetical protein [Herpetosiphonaceae bacterium]